MFLGGAAATRFAIGTALELGSVSLMQRSGSAWYQVAHISARGPDVVSPVVRRQ